MSQKSTVAVITSKKTGRGTKRAGYGKVIGSILATPRYHYDTATLRELDVAVAKIARDRPDIVVCASGDGGLKEVVTRVINGYEGAPLPLFALIRGGTMNVVAQTLGVTRLPAPDFAKMLAAKLEIQRLGGSAPFETKQLTPLRIGDKYGFMYGAGIPVNILQEYEKANYHCEDVDACGYKCPWAAGSQMKECPKCAKKLVKDGLGPRRALSVLLSALLSRGLRKRLVKPVHAKITLPDSHDPPVASFMTHTGLMVSTVDQLGMGMRGMPQAMSTPGHFMLRSTQLGFWQFLAPTTLGALWTGLPLPKTFDAVVPKMEIEYERPTERTLDGDFLPPTTSETIQCGPSLTFITG